MAIKTLVRYQKHNYATVTYAVDRTPELLTVSLSDTAALSDSLANDLTKVLLDTLASSDSINFIVTKALNDALSMGDQKAVSLLKVLQDSLSLGDTAIARTAIKELADFLVLKEWVSIRLIKTNIWTSTPAAGSRPSISYRYGTVRYATTVYAFRSTVTWAVSLTPTFLGWTNKNGTELI